MMWSAAHRMAGGRCTLHLLSSLSICYVALAPASVCRNELRLCGPEHSQKSSVHPVRRLVQLKQSRRQVADLLRNGKAENARIRVESVMREEQMLQAYEGRHLPPPNPHPAQVLLTQRSRPDVLCSQRLSLVFQQHRCYFGQRP